ncbi:MAG TPA: ribosome biogenesis GTP-binding protein YihA/YsxC [Candidatus Kapabacteria bacterium]|nr:ribosome biogenesis GTP-binding protein YihA/YsxC [Candidatus Kapabacteria bacterium]
MKERPVFVRSVFDLKDLPSDNIPQLALIGRSNVGKSSLINALAAEKNLAKTSSTPGKTLSLNFYRFEGPVYLVDTPGYGYAKQSRPDRLKWIQLMDRFISENNSLKQVAIVIDSRHEGLENDAVAMNWLIENQLHWIIILTKSDKVTQRDLAHHEKLLRMGFSGAESVFSVSSTSGKGIVALRHYLLGVDALK